MNLLDELDALNLEAAAKTKVAAMLQALLDQSKKDTAELYAKTLKIQALILELAIPVSYTHLTLPTTPYV